MACFNDLKSFLFPPFRAQAEFGKNKIAKFGLGGRFFRFFRPKFGFCPFSPRVYRLFVDRRNLGRFRAFSGSFSFVVFFVCVTHRRRTPALDAVEGFHTLVRSLSTTQDIRRMRDAAIAATVAVCRRLPSTPGNASPIPATIRAVFLLGLRVLSFRAFRSVSIRPPFERFALFSAAYNKLPDLLFRPLSGRGVLRIVTDKRKRRPKLFGRRCNSMRYMYIYL